MAWGSAGLSPMRLLADHPIGRPAEYSLGLLAMQHPYQLSISSGDQDAVQVSVLQIFRNLRQRHIGADGGWTRIHGLLDSHLRISAQRIAAEVTKYDAGDIQYYTAIGALGLHPHLDVAEAIADITTWEVALHAIFGP